MSIFFRAVLLAILMAGSANTHAFVKLVGVVPESPHANDEVSLIVQAGICDGLSGEYEIAREGNFLLITVGGIRSYGICGIPVLDTPFAIGTFLSGSYTLQLDFHYNQDFPNDEGTETVATIQFDVAPLGAGSVTPVPAVGTVAKIAIALLLTIFAIGAMGWRNRRQ